MPIGFGIVGCGMIAAFHARAIAEMADAKLVACHSSRWERAQTFAQEFNCRPCRSLAELVADPAIHIVNICTPSGAHLEPALAAAQAGKHLLIEKPLEVTLDRCDQIINACQRQKVKLATIFPSRYHRCWQSLKAAIDEGRFGTLTLGNAYIKWFRTQEYYDSGNWRGTWQLDGGGALMNQGIHTIDLLQWLMGNVQSVSARTSTLAHDRIEVEDTAVACLQFANGALGTIEGTTASYPGQLKRIEIHGSTGSVIVEEDAIRFWKFQSERKSDQAVFEQLAVHSTTGGAGDPRAIGHQAHRRLFEDFVDALREGRDPAICGSEGRRAVEVILAIYRAAQERRWVDVNDE